MQTIHSRYIRTVYSWLLMIKIYYYPCDYYRHGQKSWKINDLSQCNISFPCLQDCIDTFAGYTKVDICEEYQYEVICGENNLNYD